jgi:catechol 2,3-dioxygenase-like lactoylglutathione lyase family enzyme
VTARFDLIGLVVDDMARSLAFYPKLGLEVADDVDAEDHVEATLSGGLRMAWDTVETIKSFDPTWTPPTGGGHRIGLAFVCADPAEVDRVMPIWSAQATRGTSSLGTRSGASATRPSATRTGTASTSSRGSPRPLGHSPPPPAMRPPAARAPYGMHP